MNANTPTEISEYYGPISKEMKELLRQNMLWASSNGKEGRQARLEQPDLSCAMLANLTFDGAIMVQPKMKKSFLRCASFKGACLREADFYGADLMGVNFEGADLRGADFGKADLSYANFDGAILKRARFSHANLADATFRGADLTGAEFLCCGYSLKSIKGAKASDNMVSALLDAVECLDTHTCSNEIRAAVDQIMAIYAAAREDLAHKRAEMEAYGELLFNEAMKEESDGIDRAE